MATLSNFGEQFAAKTLAKAYQEAVTPAIVNRDYEGEIQKPGDRVNILSFLNNILLSDYSVGSDMNSETIVDAEDQLVVEKRKYYNFSLDRLEDLFTYANDIPANLLENASYVLKTAVDTYVLEKAAEAKAGSWVGTDLYVVGGTLTMASIVTTATGGTVTITFGSSVAGEAAGASLVENPRDGVVYWGGFHSSDIGKGFRLVSSATWVSPWYKISGVTDSNNASLTEWDGATGGSDFAEGDTLRYLFGGDGRSFERYGSSGDAKLTTMSGLGWEIQAAAATAVTAATIYDQTTLLSEKLNGVDVPDADRHLTVPETIKTMLLQATETQPSGISEIYSGTVINGRFARMGGFDIHVATGSKLSTRAGHPVADSGSLNGAGYVFTAGPTGTLLLANHTRFITFADKWSESRIVDAENQFAKKYQGLFLYGCKVPGYARKFGTTLFGSY